MRASSGIDAAALGHAAAATLLPMGGGGVPSFRDRRDAAKASQHVLERASREQVLGDVIVIGAVDAQLLSAAGVGTVDALLKADPAAVSAAVGPLPVSAEVISDWQDQARLVSSIPGVSGAQAQLLAGAGYRSGEAIAAADADRLCADLLAFAATDKGQQALRAGPPPDVEQIRTLIAAARAAKAA